MSSYLVTGCAGFIGSHLCETLVAAGDEVVGIDSFTDYYPRELKQANLTGLLADPRFRLLEDDLSVVAIETLLDGVDGVFHLAAQPGVRASWGEAFEVYVRDNVLATQRVFQAAAQRGLRVVWASSSSVYGNAETYPTAEDVRPHPISPYGITKLTCEQLASAYADSFGLDHVAMRYFTVYGPRQRPDMAFTRVLNALVEGGGFVVNGSGRQSRDVTYVADAVSASTLAFERGVSGAAYNVGGGTETSLLEAIALAEELVGATLSVSFQEAARGDAGRTSADTSRARADLGWAPGTPFEEGLARHADWAIETHRHGSVGAGR